MLTSLSHHQSSETFVRDRQGPILNTFGLKYPRLDRILVDNTACYIVYIDRILHIGVCPHHAEKCVRVLSPVYE